MKQRSIKRNRQPHFSLLNELHFILLTESETIKILQRMSMKKDFQKEVKESYQFLITLYHPFDAFIALRKRQKVTKCQRCFGFSLLCFQAFVCYYLHFGSINVFAYFHWLSRNIFSFNFLLFFFIVLLFIRWRFGFGNLKQVHWQKHHTETEELNATLKRRQFSKFRSTWKTNLRQRTGNYQTFLRKKKVISQ